MASDIAVPSSSFFILAPYGLIRRRWPTAEMIWRSLLGNSSASARARHATLCGTRGIRLGVWRATDRPQMLLFWERYLVIRNADFYVLYWIAPRPREHGSLRSVTRGVFGSAFGGRPIARRYRYAGNGMS